MQQPEPEIRLASSKVSIFRLGKVFLPMFAISAALPAILFLVLSPQSLTIFSSAAKTPELRVWLEPAEIISRPNLPVTLEVIASFEEDTKLVPDMTVKVISESNLQIAPDIISYNKPFRGRTVIGSVTVNPQQNGKFSISLPAEQVRSTLTEPMTVITAPAILDVKSP